MDLLQQHHHDVGDIQDELIEWLKNRSPKDSEFGITLAKQKHVSNTVRENSYKSKGPRLGINKLNRVLNVDKERKIVTVEPRVTMEQLVDATLRHGLVPAVIPEFKSITVGGAINGTALESTSHRYGQFNDICTRYEVLIGDGAVIDITAESHPDLFYGISGSYGSLGIILSVDIELIETSDWLLLDYHDFNSVEKAVQFMVEQHKSSTPPEYLEAITLSKDRTVVIAGNPIDNPSAYPKFSLSKTWDKWYYQHIHERFGGAVRQEAVKLRDYLFRQDRAGFWMGGYALHPLLLFRYILEYYGHIPKWLEPRDITKYHKVRMPSWWFRWFFGWMMDSERLYHIMHKGTEKWFAENFSIQDYYLPDDATVNFTEHVIKKYEILPIWLCPMKATKTGQLFSPHYLENGGSPLMFDVGVYGMAKDSISGELVVRDLDRLAANLGGKKMLYSYSYYTEEEFWKIYPNEPYQSLREKYFASDVFLDITKKVLN
ncbi:MAG: FAD-binding oxidoreductase [Chlamydiota bacterium]